jgi:lipid II:glycine glycyltransferase (peptidoglycan interpeptide bridge formation enzyme)
MKLHNITLSKLDEDVYNNFFNTSKYSTPFHNLNFLKALEQTRKILVLKFLVLYKNNQIIGIMPYFSHKYFLNFSMNSLPHGCYGGFLYQSENKEEIFKYLEKNKFISLLSTINSYKDTIYNNFKYCKKTKYSTWIIDTKASYDDIFLNLHSKTRNQIRKALKSNIVIRDIQRIEDVDGVLKIYRQLIEKHKIKKPYSNQIFYELFSATLYDENIIFKVAEYENKIIAYSIFLRNKNDIFYWMNASNPAYSKLNGTNGILNEILVLASNSDEIEELNLGAVPYENTGLYHFKNRWNAIEKEYFCYDSFLYDFIKSIKK